MIHIRWKAVNAYQVNQQTSLNPIASPEPGSRAGLKRNRVERRYKFMKCKRLFRMALVSCYDHILASNDGACGRRERCVVNSI